MCLSSVLGTFQDLVSKQQNTNKNDQEKQVYQSGFSRRTKPMRSWWDAYMYTYMRFISVPYRLWSDYPNNGCLIWTQLEDLKIQQFFVLWRGMSQLVFCICKNSKEAGLNASEGMNLPEWVRARRQRSGATSFLVLYIGCHHRGVAQIEGGSFYLKCSNQRKYPCYMCLDSWYLVNSRYKLTSKTSYHSKDYNF